MAEDKPPTLRSVPQVHQEVHRLFQELIHQPWGKPGMPAADSWQPYCDMVETDDAIIVEIELPGMQRQEVQIEVEGDMLRISGERQTIRRHQGRHVYHVERQHGRFVRQLKLPRSVNREAIRAEFADGILTITLPKQTQAQAGRNS